MKKQFCKKKINGEYVELMNEPCTFAVRTSSFKYEGQKISVPYIWRLSIGDDLYKGRTHREFIETISKLKEEHQLSYYKRIVVYCSDLAYCFFSMLKADLTFKNDSIFAKDRNKPLTAFASEGFEFKDLTSLAGCSMEEATSKQTYKKKPQDYTHERVFPETKLTEEEIADIDNEILALKEYLEGQLSFYKNVGRLPLTNTSRARKVFRSKLLTPEYKKMISSLTLDLDEFNVLENCFSGGYCASSKEYSGQVMHDVTSWDFTSSYLASVCSHSFPMSKGVLCHVKNKEALKELIKSYCVLMCVKLTNVTPKFDAIRFLKLENCYGTGLIVEEGKVLGGTEIYTYFTDVDFEIFNTFYHYDDIQFYMCWKYTRGYLPKEYIKLCLEFYKDKTELKGTDNVIEYGVKKSILNASCYGLMVQNPCNDEIIYKDGKFKKITCDRKACIDKYNKDFNRFTFFPWGVWVSAYSRLHLAFGLEEVSKTNDFVYSDTDSMKIINSERHQDFINKYNEWIKSRIDYICDYYKIDKSLTSPMTIYGEIKPLGAWDFDGYYKDFKTIGAKRYLVRDCDGAVKITMAGVNQHSVSQYITQKGDPFAEFTSGLEIPVEFAGRLEKSIISYTVEGVAENRELGYTYFREQGGMYIEKQGYGIRQFLENIDF